MGQPNPWTTLVRGVSPEEKEGLQRKGFVEKRFQACSERVAGVMDDESGKSMEEVLVKASYNLSD